MNFMNWKRWPEFFNSYERHEMLVDQFEDQFEQLGLPAGQQRLLLAIPLLASLSVDRGLNRADAEKVAEFLRTTLDYSSEQMQLVRQWFDSPPTEIDLGQALALIEKLRVARDVPTVDTQTETVVLMECERLLRLRETELGLESPRGHMMLEQICARLGVDLGEPWEEIAPEVFDESAESRPQPPPRKAPPVRRLRTAARRKGDSTIESGGLV